jgi:hypothetical protein
MEHEAWVPLGQGLTIGAGVSAGTLAVTILVAAVARLPWWVPPLSAVVGGLLAFGTSAVLLVLDRRRLLWAIEVGTGFDLDRDSRIGPSKGEREDPRLVYVHNPSAQRRQSAGRDFRFWLRRVYETNDATRRTWEGAKLPSGSEVTRELWELWCERLIRAGLAERPYGTAGLELRSDYQQALVTLRELL